MGPYESHIEASGCWLNYSWKKLSTDPGLSPDMRSYVTLPPRLGMQRKTDREKSRDGFFTKEIIAILRFDRPSETGP